MRSLCSELLMYEVERVKTGIPGFDKIIDGGLPKDNLVVISGDPGSGKTIFCIEFLYKGATEFDEPGVFVSLEEGKEAIIQTASIFGWDLQKLIDKKKLEIIAVDLYDFEQLKNIIGDAITKLKAKRIVIDPGVIFRLYFTKELDARKRILALGKMLKQSGCTAIITNEAVTQGPSLFGLEEYVADGVVIITHRKEKNKFVRSISVVKMRDTKISETTHPVRISNKGVEVLSKQESYD